MSGALAAAATVGAGVSAAGAADRAGTHVGAQAVAVKRAAGGHVYGGITPQSWPIIVDLDRSATKITRIVTGLDMTCTSAENFGTTDGFTALKLNSRNRFNATYGPQRIDVSGLPADIEGSITGRRSKDRSSMRGTWSYKVTFYDAAGTTVTDTCESGVVSWHADQ